jgi:hypothetical protein
MDPSVAADPKVTELESRLRQFELWLEDPVTKEVLSLVKEKKDAIVTVLCFGDVRDLSSFFEREKSFGFLAGLNFVVATIAESHETIKKELENERGN